MKRISLAQTQVKGVEVLNIGKPITQIKVPDLDKVLDMHQVDKKGLG